MAREHVRLSSALCGVTDEQPPLLGSLSAEFMSVRDTFIEG